MGVKIKLTTSNIFSTKNQGSSNCRNCGSKCNSLFCSKCKGTDQRTVKTRERKDGKTMYGHVEYVIKYATEQALKQLFGDKLFNGASKVLRKGIKTGVLLQ